MSTSVAGSWYKPSMPTVRYEAGSRPRTMVDLLIAAADSKEAVSIALRGAYPHQSMPTGTIECEAEFSFPHSPAPIYPDRGDPDLRYRAKIFTLTMEASRISFHVDDVLFLVRNVA